MNSVLQWGAATDVGRVRNANEDAFVAESMVFAVADGMGGHKAGEVASAMAADVLRERLATGAQSADVLVAAVLEANAAIFQTSRRNASQMGMGTTLTAMAMISDGSAGVTQLALANVGDSRTYLLRRGTLTRVTVDHSYVQELLATGLISEDEARSHPRRNIVTRALGIEPSVRVDSWVLPLVAGDRYVLCSDGLVDEIDDRQIAAIASGGQNPQATADRLVADALAHGGRDNVTVVVVDVLAVTDGSTAAMATATPTATASYTPTTATATAPAPTPPMVEPTTTDTAPMSTDPTTAAPVLPRRQITGRMLLFMLAVAVVLTVIITLIAVAVNRNDVTPAPTTTVPATAPTTVPATSSTTSPATLPATTLATTPSTAPTTSGSP